MEPEHELAKFFLQRDGNLMKGLFRIRKGSASANAHHSHGSNQQDSVNSFRNALFENQFVSLYAFQKHETVKKKVDKEKVKNKQRQLWAFVEKHFDYQSAHERLREPSRNEVLRQITGRGTNAKTLAPISEVESDQWGGDDSMIDPGKDLDISSEYDMLTEVESNYPDGLPTIYEEEKGSDNRDSYEETKSAHTSFTQESQANERVGVHVPTAEEIKNDTSGS